MQLPVYGRSAARCKKCGEWGFFDEMKELQVDWKWNVRYIHPECDKIDTR